MATLDITRSIDIKASVDKVWAALTESDLISQWFGDTCELDATQADPAISDGRHTAPTSESWWSARIARRP